MRPRPGWHEGSPFRYGMAITAIGLIATAASGCGGDGATKSAGSGPDKGIYVNSSSQDEFCSVLESLKTNLSAGIDADHEAVLAAIHTIKDIEPLAPEETKADWSGMQMIMQAVVDANGADTVGSVSRAEAGQLYADLSGRMSESVTEICGFALS